MAAMESPVPSPAAHAEEPTAYAIVSTTADDSVVEEAHPQEESDAQYGATSACSSAHDALASTVGGLSKSGDRDEALAKLNQDRTLSYIRAWEENKKAMSANKYMKRIAKINAWETAQKAAAEASLKRSEEILEKKKAAYVEKMKNQIAAVHKSAEEHRAVAESQRGHAFVKADETSAKYRAEGRVPKKFLCFGA